MKILGNSIWVLFGGFFMALGYVFSGLSLFCFSYFYQEREQSAANTFLIFSLIFRALVVYFLPRFRSATLRARVSSVGLAMQRMQWGQVDRHCWIRILS